ncbi:LysR family transcriptional regulator [Thaumasiovibrio sp. DFM-14]|uniref:LysR family transcriptional regulator n=1 Tax=Thaumasiovibrio sp. DFM-14 TaxID=3384792 RepID=UPI00399FF24A
MAPYTLLPHSHNGLKVFEAVGRHLSFTRAANELNITQSAVSRQVKQLEEQLNITLITRNYRSITLTTQGLQLLEVLSTSYHAIEHTISLWHQQPQSLTIRAATTFATRNLIPKLHELNALFPQHEIIIIPIMDEELSSPPRDDYDLLIFNTRSAHKYRNQANVTPLRSEFMAPVYSANLQLTDHTLATIHSLHRIHATLDHQDWKSWINHHRDITAHPCQQTTFSTLDMALNASLAGLGVTVTDLLLVLTELEQGFLLCPNGVAIQHSQWQYMAHTPHNNAAVKRLLEWVIQQIHLDSQRLHHLANQNNWQLL